MFTLIKGAILLFIFLLILAVLGPFGGIILTILMVGLCAYAIGLCIEDWENRH